MASTEVDWAQFEPIEQPEAQAVDWSQFEAVDDAAPQSSRGFSPANIARGIGERVTDLAGNVAGFTATAGANLEKDAKLGGLVWENGSLLPSYKNAEEYAAIEAADPGGSAPRRAQRALTAVDFGYKPGTTWEEVKAADGFILVAKKLATFGLETGLVSAPDMAAAVVNAPVYFTSRTEEIAQDRAKNDGRAAPDENDVAIGASTAAIVSAMEKFGAERVFNAFIKGGTAPSKILKAAVGEGGTEFVQEQIEYAGETGGTNAGWTPEQSFERGIQGMVGGVTTGGTLGGIGAAVSREGKPRPADPIDAAIEDANAIVDSAQTGPIVDPFAEQVAQQNAARQAEIDAAMPEQSESFQVRGRASLDNYPTGPVRVPWADEATRPEAPQEPSAAPVAAPSAVSPTIPTAEIINRAVGIREPAKGRRADVEAALNEPVARGLGEGQQERIITAADLRGIREGNPAFPVQENPSGSIVVGGDPKALRETLAAAGIQTKGVTSKNGTTFPVKHAAAVRAALEKSNATPIPTAEGRTPGAGEATGVQSQPSPDAPVTEAPAPIPDAGEFGADRTDVAALAQAAQPDVGYQQVAQGAPAILGEVSFDRRQAQEPIATEQRQGERRANFAERKRVDSLSLEEARRELLTSEKAGLSNERAYNEGQRRRKQAFFDLDNFKALNTKYSYAGGDQLINVVGQIMAEEAGDTIPYHIHGDEFLAEHDDEKALDDFAKRVQDRLAQVDVVVTHEDGTVHTKKGVLTSYGIGDTKADAEAALKRDKAQRAAAGLRTERGRDDGGMAPAPAEGREGGVPGAAQEVAAKPSPADDSKAAAILDAANVRGDSRLNAIEKFRAGTFTLKDLEEAFPPAKADISEDTKQPEAAPDKAAEADNRGDIQQEAGAVQDTEGRGVAQDRAVNAARANHRRLADEEIYRSDSPIKVGMPTEEVERVAANVALSWGENAREVIVHESLADAPQWMRDQVPPGDERTIQGFHDPTTGNVHLIAENLPNKSDVHRILGHEMAGHSAMEEVVNKGEVIKGGWTAVERRVDWLVKAGNKQARSLRDEVQRRGYNMADRATVTKEMLAVAVERHITDGPIGQILRQLRAAIRNLLRKAGINSLMPDADIDALVVRSLRFLKESGGRSKAVTEALEHPQLGEIDVALGKGRMGASKFATENPEVAANLEDLVASAKVISRDAESAVLESGGVTFDLVKKAGRWVLTDARVDFARSPFTETEAFKRWFGDSKVVDAEGKPLVVYHGTNSEFDTFSSSGKRDAGWHGPGFYFYPVKNWASGYGQNIISAYVSLRNPAIRKTSDAASTSEEANLIREELETAGHDGVMAYDADGTLADVVAFRPEQIKSTGNRGTFDPSDARINFARSAALPSNPRNAAGQQVGQSWVAEAPSKLDDLIYSLQDKQIDLKKAVKAVKEQIGSIADKFDPYLQEELYHGRSAKGVKDFLDTELRPLLQEMQMRKVEMAELEEFLHMRHAEERNAQIAKVNPSMPDEGSGVSTADARAYLAGLDPAKRRAYEALAKRVDAINASTRKILVDTGLETQDTIDAWEKTYKNYVPLQREDVDGGMGTGSGFSVRGSSAKRAMGSKRAVADILANVAMQRERAIVRAEKNRVAQALYGLAVQAPNPDYWIAVDPNNPDMAAMQQALVDLGANPIDAKNIVKEPKQRYVDPRTGLVTERINPALRSADNVVAMRVNGEDKFVFMSTKDPRAMRMAQAMKNLDADELGRALQVSAKVTRWMASVNTQYNPIFGVVNLTRDVQGALLNLSSTPLAGKQTEVAKNTLAALRGIYIDLRDRRAGKATTSAWAGLWEEFQNEGGQTGYKDMFRTSKDRAEAIEKEIRKIGEGKAKGLGRAMFEWLSDYNETMENAVRLAAYKVAKEQGMSAQRAASLAKSLTVNFNRKGQAASQAGALFAFFNASVQGTARIAETLSGPMGKKIIVGGVTLGAMQAVTLAAAGFDEDEPPEFVRERALIIPMGGGDYLSIPMPLGFHVLPNIGRITTEWALSGFRNTGKRIADFTGLTLDAFNPIGNAGLSLQTITPTAIDPLAALAENKDWTGKPIAMEDFNSLHPTPGHSRARDTASWISKSLSYWMNAASGGTKYKPGAISPTPDQLDYLIGQATGGVGREYLKAEQTATSLFTGEELPRHKVPLVGRFYGTTEGQSAEGGKFYENLRRINEHRAEIEGRRKDRGDVSGYLADNPEARLYRMAQKYESDVSKLRKKRRELQEKGGRDGQIKLIDQRITFLMKRFNDQVRAARDAE